MRPGRARTVRSSRPTLDGKNSTEKVHELVRMLRFFLKAFPLFIVASQILIPCYDWLRPWPSAVEQLSNSNVTFRFCVGVSSVTLVQGSRSATERSRSFLAVARHSVLPRLMTVEAADETSAATLDDNGPGGVVVWLAVVAICSVLSWRWWIRPLRADGLEGLRLAI